MDNKHSLEAQWNVWELEVKEFEPISADRRKALFKIAAIWDDLAILTHEVQRDHLANDKGLRYLGLNALKIAALNMAQKIEADEVSYFNLTLQLTHNLILTNILRLRIFPNAPHKLRSQFQATELGVFLTAKTHFEKQEKDLWEERQRLQDEIAALRDDYEMFVFTESSFEAARSFGAQRPDVQSHRSSWNAFSKLLTGMALQIREEHRPHLIKRCAKIQAQREALFENCSLLLARREKENGKDVKRVQRQLRHNLAEIKRLEKEIELTLTELSIPGIGDQASLVVKKSPEQATTFQLIKLNQSTGDKT